MLVAMVTFVLVHSPLVGPATWRAVGDCLGAEGYAAVVPELRSPPDLDGAYHERHVSTVLGAVNEDSKDAELVLVAHSGAGPLLPLIGAALRPRVRAYVFVDAGLPAPGKSRLEAFDHEEEARAFRANAVDGIVSLWPEAVLEPLIPDDSLRAEFIADAQPMALRVYEEQLPEVPGWPEAPCAYLRFSDAYVHQYADAMRLGWAVRQWQAGHFHMLVDPERVARTLIEMSAVMPG